MASKSVKLAFPVLFLFLLLADTSLGSPFLHSVVWTFLLPNHDYLYFFAFLPLISLIAVRISKNGVPGPIKPAVSSLLLLGGLLYLLTAVAQLWRTPVVPIGLITLVMGVSISREGIALMKTAAVQPRSSVVHPIVVLLCFVFLSTIYIQPWSLVSNMPDVRNVSYPNMDLSGMHFGGTSFKDVNLKKADFSRASLVGVDFSNTNLDGANFEGAKIENAEFDSSSLIGANFTGARIYQTNFRSSDLRNSTLVPSSIGRTNINNSLLCNAEFGDLRGGVYDWSGSTINESALPVPGGDSSCCGKMEGFIIATDANCGVAP